MSTSSLGTMNERQSAKYTATLKDEDSAVVPVSSLEGAKLTVIDELTGKVLNSRQAQDVFNTNGVTITEAGALTWEIEPDDSRIVNPRTQYGETETRICVLEYTWDSGNRTGRHRFEFKVRRVAAPKEVILLRGDLWTIRIEGIGDLTGLTKTWVTIKDDREKEDSESLVQIDSDDGLLVVNGEVIGTSGADDGSLTLDSTNEAVTASVKASVSSILACGDYLLEVQVETTTGTIETRREIPLTINADVTRRLT